jgi:type IV secretory pathway VirD2 relaxase
MRRPVDPASQDAGVTIQVQLRVPMAAWQHKFNGFINSAKLKSLLFPVALLDGDPRRFRQAGDLDDLFFHTLPFSEGK